MKAKKLQMVIYKGVEYTIDYRLKEFRAYIYNCIVIHHTFTSAEGKKILNLIRE